MAIQESEVLKTSLLHFKFFSDQTARFLDGGYSKHNENGGAYFDWMLQQRISVNSAFDYEMMFQ